MRNQSKKILVDAVFFQYNRSGIARVWISIFNEWVRSGFAANVLVLDRNKTAPRIDGLAYRVVPTHNYAASQDDRAMLQAVCDEEAADVFVSSYYTTPVTTPSIFMAYDMIPEVLNWDVSSQTIWYQKHEAIRHAASFIAISQNTADDLCRLFPSIRPQQVTIAHCGVDFSEPPPHLVVAFRARHGIDRPYFLLVGSRGTYKNAFLFFRAFAELGEQRSNYAIVCTGPWSTLEPEFAVHVGEGAVHMLELGDDELQCAYAGAIALAYPSTYEGFGMPITEAMACGCPVITCPAGSIPEVAGDAVIYVGPSDVPAMIDALYQVQGSMMRALLISKGLQRATQFAWQKMAADVGIALLAISWDEKSLSVGKFVKSSGANTVSNQIPIKSVLLAVNDMNISESNSFNPDVIISLGLDHHKNGRWVEAEKCYRQVLESMPMSSQANQLLGALHLQTGGFVEAERLLRLALSINSGIPEVHLNLGYVLNNLGRENEAADCYLHALRINPEFEMARKALQEIRSKSITRKISTIGIAQIKSGDLASALSSFRLLQTDDPQDPMTEFIIELLTGDKNNSHTKDFLMGEFMKFSSHYAAVLPYNLNWKIDPAPLHDFLSKNSVTVFDIGARGNDLGEIDSLKKYMNYICFDADEEECARLNKQPKNEFNDFTVLPYFLGEDSKEIDFHIYKMPAESSSYRPNPEFKKLYSPTLEIDRTVRIKSQTLDSIVVQHNLDEPDFIKIDTQGSELSILKNCLTTLSNTLFVEIEVEFLKIYDKQPLFHEVDLFMNAQGYQLLYLNRVFQSRQEYVGESRGIITFGDALYGKVADLQKFSPKKLAKYIILLINYGHIDIAYAIWKENSEVRDAAPAIIQFFKGRYAMETQFEIANMDKFICWLLTKRRTNQLLWDSDRSWPFR